jgi:hypothetical protein
VAYVLVLCLMVLFLLLKTSYQGSEMALMLTRNYGKRGINRMVLLSHLPIDCSLHPAKFQDLRCGMKFMFSFSIEVIGGGEGLSSSHGHSTHKSCLLFFYFFHLRL